MGIDGELLRFVNRLDTLPHAQIYIDFLGNNALARGGPIFFIFSYLWFTRPLSDRARLLAGLFACFAAVFISISLQFLFTPHVRPFMDAGLGIASEIPDMHLNRLGSFPSDTASLYFGLCTVIFLERPRLGIFCALWSLISIGLCRVVLGYHYPSDILAGLILGSLTVLVLTRWRIFKELPVRMLALPRASPAIVNSVMFVVMADAYNQFFGFLGILHILRVTAHLI